MTPLTNFIKITNRNEIWSCGTFTDRKVEADKITALNINIEHFSQQEFFLFISWISYFNDAVPMYIVEVDGSQKTREILIGRIAVKNIERIFCAFLIASSIFLNKDKSWWIKGVCVIEQ